MEGPAARWGLRKRPYAQTFRGDNDDDDDDDDEVRIAKIRKFYYVHFIKPSIYGIQTYDVSVRIERYKAAVFLYTIVRKYSIV